MPAHATNACSCYQCLLMLPMPAHATNACSCYQCLLMLPMPAHATNACSCYQHHVMEIAILAKALVSRYKLNLVLTAFNKCVAFYIGACFIIVE